MQNLSKSNQYSSAALTYSRNTPPHSFSQNRLALRSAVSKTQLSRLLNRHTLRAASDAPLSITMPDEARVAVEDFVAAHAQTSPYHNPEFFLKNVGAILQENLPEATVATLKNMGDVGVPDILLLKNFPVDQVVPDGDTIEQRVSAKGRVSEAAMLGMANLMGYKLQSHPNEQNGSVVHNIAPVKEKYNTVSSKGRDPFYLHTENPFEENPPEFLILVGLEADPTAKTTYFPVSDFLANLPEWVKDGMRKPEFEIRSGAGVDGTTKGQYSLLTNEQDSARTRLRLYQNMERIMPLTENAAQVLQHLEQAFAKVEADNAIRAVGLQKGESIIFNNGWTKDAGMHGVMHGRAGYISNPNRWLQRGFFHRPEVETLPPQ